MSEHDEQKALIQWCDAKGYPYNMIFAIPNGGHRHKAVAAKLKAEGVRAGVPDLFLPVYDPRWPFAGLFIEMKTKKGKMSKAQKEWKQALENENYKYAECYGWDQARAAIEEYLEDYF